MRTSTRNFSVVVLLGMSLLGAITASAAVKTSAGTGPWNTAGTWTGGVPATGDSVIILSPHVVTVAATPTNVPGAVTVNSGGTLTVNGGITLTITGDGVTSFGSLAGAGTLGTGASARNIILTNGSWTFSGTNAGTNLVIQFTSSADQILQGVPGASASVTVNKAGGQLKLGGNVAFTTLTLTAGTVNPNGFKFTNTGFTFNGGTAIVDNATFTNSYAIAANTPAAGTTYNYSAASPAINGSITYQNLTFSGSGTTANPTADLTIQGNLSNTGGGTLNFSARNVTLNGSVAATSVAAMTTTGTVTMSKAAATTATLTGNMNAANLTVNGGGTTGTLSLGTLLTHTITSVVNASGGLLNGGSSTLNIGGNFSDGGGAFNGQTGTVVFNGSGAQSIPGSVGFGNFNNLQVNKSGNTATLAGNDSLTGNLTVTSGTLDLGGSLVIGKAAADTLTVSNGAVLKVGGTNGLPTTFATRTYGTTGIVEYSGTNQNVAGESYAGLRFTGAGTKIAVGAISVADTLTINGASTIFRDSSFQVTSTGTLNIPAGQFRLGAVGTATTFPLFSTVVMAVGTTIDYMSTVAQTVSTTHGYRNLTFTNGGAKTTAAGTLTIAGNWTVGSPALLNTNNTSIDTVGNISGAGAITLGSGTINIGGNWTGTGRIIPGTSTVTFDGISTTQTIAAGLRFNNIVVGGTNNTLQLAGSPDSLNGNLTVLTSSIFDEGAAGRVLRGSGASDTLHVAAGGRLLIRSSGTTPYGSSFPGLTPVFDPNSIVEYQSGAASNIDLTSFGSLQITGGNFLYSLVGNTTVNGDLTSTNGTDLTTTASNRSLTITGDLLMDTGTLTCNGSIISVGGDFTQTGTLSEDASTFVFNGTGNQSFRGTNYINIIINKAGGAAIPAAATTLTSNLTVSAGTLRTNNLDFSVGGNTAITGILGITNGTIGTPAFNNLTINSGGLFYADTVNDAVTVNGNLQNDGTFRPGTGAYTFPGAAKTISGTNTVSIPNATITGTDTNKTTLVVANLTVNGGTLINNDSVTVSTALAGTGTFLNAANSVLTIGGTSAINILTATANPNTIKYAGSGAQTVKSTTYHHLVIDKTGPAATLGGLATVNGNLTLSTDTLATAGNNISIGGDWINNGGRFTGSGTVTFTSTAADQAIAGTASTQSFNNLTVNKSGRQLNVTGSTTTLDVNGALAVTLGTFNAPANTFLFGNLTTGGTFNGGSGTLTLDGTGTQTLASGTTFNNVVVNGTANTVQPQGNISLNGNLTVTTGIFDETAAARTITGNGGSNVLSVAANARLIIRSVGATPFATSYPGWETVTLNPNSITEYASTTSSRIDLTSLGSLVISGAVRDSLNGNTTVNGDLTSTNSTPFSTNASNNYSLSVSGNLNMGGSTLFTNSSAVTVGGQLNLGSGSLTATAGTVTIGSDFFGTGTLTSGTSTLIFNGAGADTIATTSSFGNYNNITIAKSGGSALFNGDATLNGALNDSAGTLNITNINLTVTGTTTIADSLKITSLTGTKTFGNIVMQNGGVFHNSANDDITINGNLQNDGTMNAGTGTYTFAGSGKTMTGTSGLSIPLISISAGSDTNKTTLASNTVTVGGGTVLANTGTATVNTALSGTGTFINAANGTLTVKGTSGITTLTASAAGNTVAYRGSGAQTVKPVAYQNLTLGGSGVKTLTSVSSIGGNFTFTDTASATAAAGMTIGGNFTIGSGTTFNASTFTHNLAGNWSNTGTFTASTGRFIMNGSAPQTMSGSTFNKLTINKSSGDVSLLTNETVSDSLVLTNGIITTNANRIIIGPSGKVVGGSTGSHVSGKLAQIYTGTGSKTFPIGKAGNFRPMTVNYTTFTGTDTVTAEQIESPLPETLPPGVSLFSDRYWPVSRTSANALTYSMTLDGNGFSPSSSVVMLRANGSPATSFSTTGGPLYTTTGLTTSVGNFALGQTTAVTTVYVSPTGSDATGNGTVGNPFRTIQKGIDVVSAGGTVNVAAGIDTQSIASSKNLTLTGTGTLPLQNVSLTSAIAITLGSDVRVEGSLGLATGSVSIGAHTLFIDGSVSVTSGALVGGATSNVTIGGTGASTGLPPVVLKNLVVDRATGISLTGNVTVGDTLTIAPAVSGSILDDNGFQITSTGTLNLLNGGRLKLGSATAATAFPAFATRNISSGTTVEYASDSAQTIAGAPAYAHLTVSGTGMKTAGSALAIAGNFTMENGSQFEGGSFTHTIGGNWTNNGGTTNPSGGMIIFNNTLADQEINGTAAVTVFWRVAVNKPGRTLKMEGNTTILSFRGGVELNSGTFDAGNIVDIDLQSDWANNGGTFVPRTSTVKFFFSNVDPGVSIDGLAVSQTFYNLFIDKASQSVTVGGSTTTLNITGSLTIFNGEFNAGTATSINVTGDWINSGHAGAFFTPGVGKVSLVGTVAAQSLNGDTFNDLTLNNSFGALLLNDVAVNGILALQSGNVTTDSNAMVIGPSGSVSRPGGTPGHVVGNLRKNVSTGGLVSRAFEIGDGTNYLPIDVTFANVTNVGTLTASQASGDHPDIATSGIDSSKSVNRYWTLTSDAIAFGTYDATFRFLAGEVDGGSTSGFVVNKFNSPTWSAPGTGTVTSTSIQATGATSFSAFAAGKQLIDHYLVSVSSPRNAGTPFTSTVTAQDKLNQTVTSDSTTSVAMTGTGSVDFDSDGNGTFGDTTKTLTGGTFPISTKDNVAETVSITATDANGKTGTLAGVVIGSNLLHHFDIATISSPKTAGTAFSITMTAKDSLGNTITGFDSTANLSTTAGVISPSVTGAFVGGQRTESVLVTLADTGRTITVSRAGKSGTSNAFDVNVGALHHFDIATITSPQTAGTSFNITMTAKDSTGNTVTSYSDTASLSTTAGVISPSVTGSFVAGQRTESVLVTLAGTGKTITVTGGGKTGTSNTFDVNPGTVHHFVFATVSSPQIAGTAFNVTVTAQDSNNNTATSFVDTVGITSTGTLSAGGGTTASFVNGVLASHSVTISNTGSFTLTATHVGATGTSNAFTVNPGTLDHFDIATITGPQTAGTPFNITMTAKDANGNTITGFDSTANLSTTAGVISPLVTGAFVGGQRTESVSVTLADTGRTITVTRGGASGTSNTFTVQPGALDNFLVESSLGGALPAQIAGTPFSIRVTARDANNNTVTGYVDTVGITSTGTLSAGGGTTASFVNGILASHSVTVSNTGSFTLTATGNGKTGTSAAFTVNPGALDHFDIAAITSPQTAGTPFNITMTAKDANGNTITGFDSTANLSTTAGVISPSVTGAFVGGQRTESVLVTLADTGRTITVSRAGKSGTSNAFDVNVGALHHFDIATITSPQTAGTSFNITMTAKDSTGNTVTSYSDTASLSTTAGVISPSVTGSFVAGQRTESVLVTLAGTGKTITVTGGGKTGTSNTFDVNPGTVHHFVFATVSSPQIAGTAFNVTVTAQDSNNNTATSFVDTVGITSTGTLSAGGGTTASFVNGVLASHSVTISNTGSFTLTATHVGATGTSNAFTVNPGTLDHFDIATITGPQTAGTPFNITMTAKDANGNTITGFDSTANLSTTAGVISPLVTGAFVGGQRTESVSVTLADTGRTITVTRGGASGTSNTFTVQPGALDNFLVESSLGGALPAQIAGTPFSIRVTARDANNNTVTGYVDTVGITSTGTLSAGGGTTASFVNGILASHSVTVSNTGSFTLTATGNGKTGTSAAFTVNPGALDHFDIAAITSPQTAGTPFNITMTAKDANGNTITGFDSTANLSTTAGVISPSVTGAFVGGQRTESVLVTLADTGRTITVSRAGKSGTSNAFDVNVGALHHFDIATITSPQTAGTSFNITMTAKDSTGNTVTSYSDTASLSTTAGVISPSVTGSFVAGQRTESVLVTLAGTGKTITVTGGGKTGTSNTFDVNPGTVHHFVFATVSSPQIAGTAFNVTVTAQDSNNNTATSFVDTVGITSTGTLSAGGGTTASFVNGVLASHSVTISNTGSFTLTATHVGATGTSNAFTVNPGTLDHFDIATITGPQTAGTPFNITMTAKDANGNTITGFDSTANLSTTAGVISPLVTGAFVGGQRTESVSVTLADTGRTITVTRGGASGTSNTFTVQPGALDNFLVESSLGGALPAQIAGTPFSIRVTARDANNNTVTGYVDTVGITSTGTLSAGGGTTASFVNGILASHSVTVSNTGSFTLTATGNGKTGTSAAFTVNPGALDHFDIAAITSPQTAGTPFNITMTAKDANGNTITGFDSTANLSTTAGVISPSVTGAFVGGQRTESVLVTLADTGRTITVSRAGKSGTSNAFDVNVGALHHFDIATITSPQTAGTSFNITMTAKDSTGNTVTSYSDTASLSTTAGVISPSVTGSFVAGQRTESVLVTLAGTGKTITVTGGGKTGTSNTFDVNPGVLTNFLVESSAGGPIPSQTSETTFGLRVTARDAQNNTVSGFAGTVDISSTGTLSLGAGTTAGFTAGVLVHNVRISNGGNFTITATQTGDTTSGTSNSFTVSAPAVVYVSPTGNDVTGDGTSGNPFLTIQRGINVVTDSGTVNVAAGILTESISVGKNITLTGIGTLPLQKARLTASVTLALGSDIQLSDTLDIASGSVSIGAHTLALNGAVSVTSGSLVGGGTSNITVGGTGPVLILPPVVLNTLVLDRANGLSLSGALTLNGTLTIGQTVSNCLFDDNGFQVTSTGTLNLLNNGTLKLGSVATATIFPGFTIINITPGATVEYASGVAQSVSAAPVYAHITFSGAASKTAAGPLIIGGNVTIQSGTTFDGAGFTHTIGGDWTNSGTFTAGSGTIAFNSATVNQSINSTATAQTFNNLVMSKASGTTLTIGGATTTLNINGTFTLNAGAFDYGTASSINILGNWTNNGGTTNPLAGTVTFGDTTADQEINGTGSVTVFYQVVVNKPGRTLKIGGTSTTIISFRGGLMLNAGTFDAGNVVDIDLQDDWTNNGGTFIPRTSTVKIFFSTVNPIIEINGSATSQTFNNLYFDKGSQTTTVGGSTTTLNVGGSLTILNGEFAAGTASAINLSGDWINSEFAGATFTAGASTVSLVGTTALQSLNRDTFNNLVLNNSLGAALLNNITVNGILTLQNGKLSTGSSTMIIGPSGSVARPPATPGHVVGNLRKTVVAGAAVARTFEIGDAVSYLPIDVTFGNVTVSGTLTGSTTAGDHSEIDSSGLDPNASVNRYWTLTNNGISFDNYDATLNFVAGDVDGGSTNGFVVNKFDSPSWSEPATGTVTATSIQATGMTSFSSFAAGRRRIHHYAIAAPSPNQAGTAFATLVTAQNRFNQIVATDSSTSVTMSGTGSVQFDSDGNGTFGDNAKTLTGGTFTISTKDTVSEIVNITATDANSKTGTQTGVVINSGSLDHFVFANISSPQTVGTAFNVTITAKDVYGNTVTGFDSTANLSTTAGSINPLVTGAFVGGQRTESVSVTLAGTGQTITATRSAATGTSNTFTVNAGALHHFDIATISSPQTAGVSFNVLITAKDSSGNTVIGFDSTANLSTTAGVISPLVTGAFVAGQRTESVAVTLADTGRTITVTRGGATGTSNTFTVNAGALHHFAFANISSPQTSGVAFNVTITAQDSNNNTATGFTQTVDISSNGTLSAGGGTTASFVNGILASHSVTISNTGSFTVTATRTGGSETGTSNSFTVNSGALHHFDIATISSPQTAGISFNVLITAKDSSGNTVTGFDSTANLSTTAGVISPLVTGAFVGGQRTESVAVTLADTGRTITVTRGGATGTSNTFTVNPGTLDHFTVAAISSPQTAGVSFNITMTAKDANSNTVVSFDSTANLSTTAGSISPLVTGAFANGQRTESVSVTLADTGRTITVTRGGANGTSNTFTVNAGSVHHFVFANISSPKISGVAFNVTITAQDSNNNTATGFTQTVDISSTGALSAGGGTTASFVNGILASHSVTISNAGSFTVTATRTGGSETGTSNTFTVNAGALHHFDIATISSPQTAGVSFNVLITAKDSSGNTVIGFDSTANLSTTAGVISPLVTGAFVAGQRTESVAVTLADTGRTITVTRGGATGTSNTFTVNAGALHHFAFANISSPQTSGVAFNVTITAQDSNNNTATGFTQTVDISSNGTLSAGGGTTASFVNGILASHSVTISNAGSFTVTATRTGGSETGTSNSFTVNSGALHHFDIATISSPQTAGISFNVLITAKDSSGNTVTGFDSTANLSTTAGVISPLVTGAFVGGQRTESVAVTLADTGRTITVTRGGATGTSNTFTVNPGTLDHFTVAAISSPQTAGVSFNITMTAKDANSNTVVSFDSTANLSTTAGSISPLVTGAFANGQRTESVAVTLADTGRTITVTRGGANGTSNTFTVNAGSVHHFVFANISSPKISGVAFNVAITAQDSNNNTATGFTQTVDISSTGALSAGGGTTASFVNGILASHSVTISNAGSFTVTATRTGGSETGTSNTFTVNAGVLHHFDIATISSPQTAGIAFNVLITAKDSSGNTVIGFDSTANLSTTAGVISPLVTGAFVNGQRTESVSVTLADTGRTITVTRGGATGTSNAFTVNAGTLNNFLVESSLGGGIPSQSAGTPFSIRVIARDANNNTVTGFTDTVGITSTGTLTSGGGTTASFVNGILASHSVTISNTGSFTITATHTGATGTSNAFTVNSGALNNFLVESSGGGVIPTQTAGTSFNIKITARDGAGNTVTGFAGRVIVTSTGVISAGGDTSASFINGVLALHSITIANGGSFTITGTKSPGGPETGTSNLFTVDPVVLNAKAFLQGPYGGGSMNTTLRSSGFIPKHQPYNVAPWNYTGTDSVPAIPAGVVDWVLVELRTGTAAATKIATRAAFLKSDGSVVDTNGTTLKFNGVSVGSYYVVIRHRNHLAIMSAAGVALTPSSGLYDFSSAVTQAFGSGSMKNLGGGVFGLYAGDSSKDGFIDSDDFTGPDNDVFESGYLNSDHNMDAFVDSDDFTAPDNNVFNGTNVPN